MLARLRESIGPAVGEAEDAQAQQLASVLRMLQPESVPDAELLERGSEPKLDRL